MSRRSVLAAAGLLLALLAFAPFVRPAVGVGLDPTSITVPTSN